MKRIELKVERLIYIEKERVEILSWSHLCSSHLKSDHNLLRNSMFPGGVLWIGTTSDCTCNGSDLRSAAFCGWREREGELWLPLCSGRLKAAHVSLAASSLHRCILPHKHCRWLPVPHWECRVSPRCDYRRESKRNADRNKEQKETDIESQASDCLLHKPKRNAMVYVFVFSPSRFLTTEAWCILLFYVQNVWE